MPAGTTLDVVLAYLYGNVPSADLPYFGLDAWIDIYNGPQRPPPGWMTIHSGWTPGNGWNSFGLERHQYGPSLQ